MPMTPFMGVLISWLMLARNSLLARLAASACADRLREPEVRLADFRLRLFALADVAQDARHSRGTPLFVEEKLRAHGHGEDGAVLPFQIDFIILHVPVLLQKERGGPPGRTGRRTRQ